MKTLLVSFSNLAIILLRKTELFSLLKCVVALHAMFLFFTVPWIGLHSVIVVFPSYILTYLSV